MSTKSSLSAVDIMTAIRKHHQALLAELGLDHSETDINPVHLIRHESLLEKIIEHFITERVRLMKK